LQTSQVPNILGLFAKYPEPGHVKTRLAAQTSPQWAAAIARACLLDTLNRLADMPAERVLVYSPAQAHLHFDSLSAGRFALVPQSDGDLGQRMSAFLSERQARGAERIVVLGADSPTVPTAFVHEAFRLLNEFDVVIGPATDGGYYLLGCGQHTPPIFDNISWGSPSVLPDTVKRLSQWHGRLTLLPPWYDVDTLDDWLFLTGHIAAMRQAGIDPHVPHLEELLACLDNPIDAAARED
jgi:uncharacterized protein